jgi:hypothetical protein
MADITGSAGSLVDPVKDSLKPQVFRDARSYTDPNVRWDPSWNSYRLGLGYLGDQFGAQLGNAGLDTSTQYGNQAAAAQGRWNPNTMANYGPLTDPYRQQYNMAWQQGQDQLARGQGQIGVGNANVAAGRQQVVTGQAGLGVQHQNLEYLRDVQLGRQGPSLAELQMQQGTEEAIRAQRSAALGTPGWNPAAQAQAARLGEDMQLRNIQATGQQRAAEQATARGMYLQGLGQYGQTSAGLGQQIAGVGGEIQGLAGLEQGLGSMAQGQQGSALQAQQLGMGQAEFNAAQTLEAMRMNDALSLGYGDLGRQWYETGLRPLEFEAQLGADYQDLMAQQQMGMNANRTNLLLGAIENDRLNDAARQQQYSSILGGVLQYAGLPGTPSDRTMKQNVEPADDELASFAQSMARAYAAGAAQDVTPRRGAEPRSEQKARVPEPAPVERTATPGQEAAAAALAATDPYAFRYTPEATARYGARTAPQTQRYGIMAQDLARTPAGATAVMRGPDGKLAIDPGQLAVLDAMATGDHERRLAELERRRSGQPQFSASRYGRGV